MTIVAGIIVLLLIVVGIWAILTYNAFVKLRNQQSEAWSSVDVQLQKRSNLVPPLVACVTAYRDHEFSTLTQAAQARNESALVPEMRKLIALAEDYPELKASGNFRDLMLKLVTIEDDLQYARRYYNGSVRDFRNLAESFPSLVIGNISGMKPGEFFEVEGVLERNAPNIDFKASE